MSPTDHKYKFSSARGKITYMLMSLNNNLTNIPLLRILAMMQTMPDVTFIIWCAKPEVADWAKAFFIKQGITCEAWHYKSEIISIDVKCILIYEYFSDVDVWIRDAFLPTTMQENEIRLFDTMEEDGKDGGWSDRYARLNMKSGLKFNLLGTPEQRQDNIGIAGGDVLADGEWLFLGKDAHELENLVKTEVNPDIKTIILSEKKDVAELYHLDLFLTLTGCWEAGRYLVMLGKCFPLQEKYNDMADRCNDCLEAIASRLENEYSFKVLRNPLPVGPLVYSYNNCVVEKADPDSRVWLPAYSFDMQNDSKLISLEEGNIAKWEQLGFTVHLVNASFADLNAVKAGLHCITNEVRS